MNLTYNSRFALAICRVFTTITTQNLGFEPQNMLWGDSMPNRPPTQKSWLTLESLCWHSKLGAESLQLVSNSPDVRSALNCCLYLPHPLFRDLYFQRATLHLCMHPLNLCELPFNTCYDREGFINPCMNTCFEFFLMARCIHMFL